MSDVIGKPCWVPMSMLYSHGTGVTPRALRLAIPLFERGGIYVCALEAKTDDEIQDLADDQLISRNGMTQLNILDELAIVYGDPRHFRLVVKENQPPKHSFRPELVIQFPRKKSLIHDAGSIEEAATELHAVVAKLLPDEWTLDLLIWMDDESYSERLAPPHTPAYIKVFEHLSNRLVERHVALHPLKASAERSKLLKHNQTL